MARTPKPQPLTEADPYWVGYLHAVADVQAAMGAGGSLYSVLSNCEGKAKREMIQAAGPPPGAPPVVADGGDEIPFGGGSE